MRCLIIATILAAASYAQAGEPLLPIGGFKKCRNCYPEVKCEPITRHCYEIECEEICVPGVTFYLGKLFGKGKGKGDCCGCDGFCPNPGYMKTVRTYKKVEYECGEKMVCDWSGCGNGKGGGKISAK